MIKPLNYPEIKNLLIHLLPKLLGESGRGAILIATSHIEDFLTELIKAVLPKELTKRQQERLFSYPGNLSSFSSKIEIAYAFRIINSNLYERLHALRKIRNDAAHSHSNFDLHELNERMAEVYNLGPDIPSVIKKDAIEMMLHFKMNSLKVFFEEEGIELDQQKEHVNSLLSDKELLKKIELQVPYWELLNGICIICGFIMYYKEKMTKLTENINTWSDLVKEEN